MDKKADAIEKREAGLTAKEEELRKKSSEIERLSEECVQELERISGLTSEQAKEYLLKTVEDEVKHDTAKLYKELERMGVPILFINSFYPELDIPHISLDDREAGRMVTQHLLDCGHMNIAGIFKGDDGQGHQRYAGYVDALMEADIKVKGKQVIWIDSDEIEEMRDDCGRVLKRIKGCTACVCYNDEVANKMVGICMDQGIRIPDDLSIVGIDNSDLSRFCEIPFTSADNPVQELGKIAAEMMIDKYRESETLRRWSLCRIWLCEIP